ncbi:CRISPR-associated endonuclease Cas1 [Methanospirillum stamsii]|uniref:CRISPR-associated endonuclease Cas1 n=1 Tax=Methanospirillum stamsii TaxID=1277351 RepID=A0A2V2N4N5_9EURY|nr:CRISPR-associated endonuclease Cas1 [Methanospirillum stamsii]PWR70461.1 CRISPR-associated endonuclease Cas1 [Methanospirillum stamsii]
MSDRSDLVINGYGASVRKKSNRFIIENEGEKYEFAASQIGQLLVTGSALISSDALKLAADEGIDLVVCTKSGDPSCRIVPCHGKGIATVRRNQITAAGTEAGYSLVAIILRAKIQHVGRFLRIIGKRRENPDLITEGEAVERIAQQIPEAGLLKELSETLRGIEGQASHRYFSALTDVIPAELYHGHRSQHPATDVFNAYLNYGYGILYNEVETACILAGLDPYAGFLHGDRYGNKALVYDLIEQFRQPIIDHVVVTLAVREQMDSSDIDEKGWLVADARRRAITAVIGRLDDERDIQGKKTSFRSFIRDNIRKAGHTLSGTGVYHPLDWRWR